MTTRAGVGMSKHHSPNVAGREAAEQALTFAGLDLIADHINQELGGKHPELVFHFDCCARGKLMFRDQEKLQLLKRLRQAVGADVPWAGFHTFGEIGPVGKHNCNHNYTAVVLVLG